MLIRLLSNWITDFLILLKIFKQYIPSTSDSYLLYLITIYIIHKAQFLYMSLIICLSSTTCLSYCIIKFWLSQFVPICAWDKIGNELNDRTIIYMRSSWNIAKQYQYGIVWHSIWCIFKQLNHVWIFKVCMYVCSQCQANNIYILKK